MLSRMEQMCSTSVTSAPANRIYLVKLQKAKPVLIDLFLMTCSRVGAAPKVVPRALAFMEMIELDKIRIGQLFQSALNHLGAAMLRNEDGEHRRHHSGVNCH